MNNFKRYANREEYIIHQFVNNNEWLSNIVSDVKPDNTGFHDYKLILNDGKQIIVEIKEEEYYWYSKTGNIGLDFLSAFSFKNDFVKNKYYHNNLWVNKGTINEFIKEINVDKFGKLFTCDANIQLFYCEDENKNPILLKAYSNIKLKENSFVEYLKNNYNLRINNKKNYKLKDDWESAAFFIQPSDKRLEKCEINSYDDLIGTL